MDKHTEVPHGTEAVVTLNHKELGRLHLKEQKALSIRLDHTSENDQVKIRIVNKHTKYGSVSINLDWIHERGLFEDTKWVSIKDDDHNDEITDGYTDSEDIEYKKLHIHLAKNNVSHYYPPILTQVK